MSYEGSPAICLFLPLPWRFHGPICFNPRECCRRNRFLFTLIKIIFCRARSNGQNVTSMALSFFQPAVITQQATPLFPSVRSAKDSLPTAALEGLASIYSGLTGFIELMGQCRYIFGLLTS